MRPVTITAVAFGIVMFVGACAPRMHPEILKAEQALSTVEADPAIARYAKSELDDARDTIQRARIVWKEQENNEEVAHLTYVAGRQLEIAKVTAERIQAENLQQSLQ